LPHRVDSLSFSNLVVVFEVVVKVGLELFVSYEALAAIGALKFNSKVDLVNGDYVLLFDDVRLFFQNIKVHK